MRRRALLSALASVPVLAACSSTTASTAQPGQGASTPAGPFRFKPGGYETEVMLDRPATRVVCDIYSAAALQPYGIVPVGVWGYGHDGPGRGELDMAKQNVIGLDAEFSLEKLVASRPDVVIGVGNQKGTRWTWWDEKVATEATKIAPFVPIAMSGRTPLMMIEEYGRLATALGVTVSEQETQHRKDLQAALDKLKALAARRGDLTVMPINATTDKVYTSTTVGVTRLLADLGLKLVGPPSPPGAAWATSSWEVIGEHKADVLLLAGAAAAAVKEVPLYKRLPAVQAGQVGEWDDKRAYVSKLYAAWVTELTALLDRSRDIVS